MATYTSHLNLKLPDYSDTADINDLNNNFKKIDDAIASGGTGGGTGGGIVTETDPTVPSWAKQPSKPTYTAAEVGALPDTTVIPTVPSALPNPQPIVINGISYDGSERKEITVSAGDGGSITETDPTVPAWAKAENKPSYTAEEVGALPSTYKPPVTSVNGKTGAVSLVASDVGALPNTTVIPTVPNALKNPYPLTINGVSYDGSEAKTVTIESTGGGASVELDTTLTQYGKAADAGAVGNAIAQETAAREAAVNSLNEANVKQDTEIGKKANDADLAAVAKSGSYEDLKNKPTIPTVPTALKNPNKLKLTGAVTAEYDGSAEVSVEIPAGGGNDYTLPIASATTLGGVKPIAATADMTQDVGVTTDGKLKAPAVAAPSDSQIKTAVDAFLTANPPSGVEWREFEVIAEGGENWIGFSADELGVTDYSQIAYFLLSGTRMLYQAVESTGEIAGIDIRIRHDETAAWNIFAQLPGGVQDVNSSTATSRSTGFKMFVVFPYGAAWVDSDDPKHLGLFMSRYSSDAYLAKTEIGDVRGHSYQRVMEGIYLRPLNGAKWGAGTSVSIRLLKR